MKEIGKKRKDEEYGIKDSNKKSQGPRQWRTPKKNDKNQLRAPSTIEPGNSGIWATCDMHKEAKCASELRDLLSQYADETCIDSSSGVEVEVDEDSDRSMDIETDIRQEIEAMQKAQTKALFQSIDIDLKCVTFFRTQPPVDPVALVHRICKDAQQSSSLQKSRWIRRLTPMSLIGKATEKGLEEVAKVVLFPHFHREGNPSRRFAIRTTIRNHTVLKRDAIIKRVVDVVGDAHTVDLEHYDLLILVDFYKNICGMSVIGNDFESLKRYNLAEIYSPTMKPQPQLHST